MAACVAKVAKGAKVTRMEVETADGQDDEVDASQNEASGIESEGRGPLGTSVTIALTVFAEFILIFDCLIDVSNICIAVYFVVWKLTSIIDRVVRLVIFEILQAILVLTAKLHSIGATRSMNRAKDQVDETGNREKSAIANLSLLALLLLHALLAGFSTFIGEPVFFAHNYLQIKLTISI